MMTLRFGHIIDSTVPSAREGNQFMKMDECCFLLLQGALVSQNTIVCANPHVCAAVLAS